MLHNCRQSSFHQISEWMPARFNNEMACGVGYAVPPISTMAFLRYLPLRISVVPSYLFFASLRQNPILPFGFFAMPDHACLAEFSIIHGTATNRVAPIRPCLCGRPPTHMPGEPESKIGKRVARMKCNGIRALIQLVALSCFRASTSNGASA